MKNKSGFTLIELVVVIVVLGILAAVAVPKFVNLKADAADAAVKGVAGSLASASALNYATELTKQNGQATTECNDTVATSLLVGTTFGSSEDYSISEVAGFSASPVLGDTATCRVTDNVNTSSTADFLLIYVN